MVSKTSLFAIVILFNLISVSFAIKAIISGRLKCNETDLTGVKVSICDGRSSKDPAATGKSDSDGRFALTVQLQDTNHYFRASIYHNCTLNGTEEVYTRQRTYTIPNTTPYPNYTPQLPFGDIQLFNATITGNFTQCN
uniref:ZP domain-containing protein n=1 Tax=Parastrongyloides trichosuri TaxID=131310 RepID=A0A0N4ZXU6_PARTI